MSGRKIGRLAALMLALLSFAAVMAGCNDIAGDRICSFCGVSLDGYNDENHGLDKCVVAAPCGFEGHYLPKGKTEDGNGNTHIACCTLCGELLCFGNRHGEGECRQEKRGFDDLKIEPIAVEYDDPMSGDHDDVDTSMCIGFRNANYFIACNDKQSAYIYSSGEGYSFSLLTHNGSAVPANDNHMYNIALAPGMNKLAFMLTAENGDNRFGSFGINNTITPPAEDAPEEVDTLSGDNSLRSFYVEFPNGTTVDMKDPDVRKAIAVSDVTSAVVTARASHGNATVSGDKGNITLVEGENKFRVTVTAEDGSKAYFNYVINVTATPAVSSDASLSSLSLSAPDHTINLSPAFSPDTYAYSTEVFDLDSLTVSASANHAGAAVSGAGARSLTVGENVLEIVVEAEDGATQLTYTVTVTVY